MRMRVRMRMGREKDRGLPDIGANSTCCPKRHLVNNVLILRQKTHETTLQKPSHLISLYISNENL
jgi:hypothetical protein